MEHVLVDDVCPLTYWIPWEPLFPPIYEFFWHTFEFNDLHVMKHLGPYCWGYYCRCGTCPHNIWGIWCTPRTQTGRWTYLFPFLWTLLTQSYKNGFGIPVGVLLASQSDKRRVFLIRPVRSIYSVIKLYSWYHKPHWSMLPWIFILCFYLS